MAFVDAKLQNGAGAFAWHRHRVPQGVDKRPSFRTGYGDATIQRVAKALRSLIASLSLAMTSLARRDALPQKSNLVTLSLVKMKGEPSRISLPLTTLSLPSLPASTEVAPGFNLPSATARIT